jgi:hypothetical protein
MDQACGSNAERQVGPPARCSSLSALPAAAFWFADTPVCFARVIYDFTVSLGKRVAHS